MRTTKDLEARIANLEKQVQEIRPNYQDCLIGLLYLREKEKLAEPKRVHEPFPGGG